MKYTPSALVSEFSGAQGSTVASHNRFGPYFRNRVIGVNPNSASQQNARNSLSTAAKGWAGLTAGQRAAWATAAASVVLVDRLGRPYRPSGFQYFMAVNRTTYVYSGSTAIITAVPAAAAPPALLTLTPTVNGSISAFSVAYTATPLNALTKAIIECAPGLSAGIGYIKPTLFRQISITAAAAASPANILAAYTAKFGSPVTGRQYGVRVTAITSDGQRSAPLSTSVIAV